MKCVHCGGQVILQEGFLKGETRVSCLQCGREPRPKESVMENSKICSKCKKEKDIDGFGIYRSAPDGHHRMCLECKKAYDADYRARKREKPRKKIDRRFKVNRPKPDPPVVQKPFQKIEESITLPPEFIKAVKRSVVREVIGLLEERYC